MRVDAQDPASYWSAFAIAGAINLVIGILVIAYPDPSIKLLGVFFGIDLLIAAVFLIVRGAGSSGSGADELLLGILALIAGVIVIRNPGETVTLLAIAFAIYLVVAGALAIAAGIINRGHRGVALLRGVVLAGIGTVILCWPDIGLSTLAILVGIALCLQGLIEILEAFLLRTLRPQPT